VRPLVGCMPDECLWLNSIEPQEGDGKQAVVEPDR
jgi:hypothetical protein